ncbi:MAG: hypothetical protein ACK4TA_01565 [Saprospiraceae bacterium]
MKYGLIIGLFSLFIIQVNAQITHPGKITTLDGKVIEGEITNIPNKTFFQGIRFIDAAGRESDYLPGDIKGFFVNEDYAFPANYESIQLDTFGIYFFHNKFEDGSLKYLFSELPLAESGERQVAEVYMVDNQVVMADYNPAPLEWLTPKAQVDKGGIITEKGDTLRGSYTIQRSKLQLKSAVTNQLTTYELNKIRGFFNEQATYYIVDVIAQNQRGGTTSSKEIAWAVVDGPVIQLLARQVDLTTYQQGYNTYYDNWGRLRRYPTTRAVKAGNALMFTIRHHVDHKVLNFLTDPYQPPTRLGNLNALREWLQGYPALQSAVLSNTINSEKALVHLYNLHLNLERSVKK